MKNLKYYGDYLVGTQSSWVAFANEFGLDVQNDLLPLSRKSASQTTGGEWLYLIELWNNDFHMIVRAWKHGLVPLKQWQARQLGGPIANITGSDGQPIISVGNIIPGREEAAMQWVFSLEPQMPDDLTPAQTLSYISSNNTKQKLIELFNAYEVEELI